MVDMHCHILPEMDDGARSRRMAFEMCKMAVANGVTDIIATPHMLDLYANDEFEEKRSIRLEYMNRLMKEYEIPLTIHGGAEVFASKDILYSPDLKPYTLAGSRYLLFEFDFAEATLDYAKEVASVILSQDLIPVLAHPERYRVLQQDYDTVFALKEMGCLFQLNKGSLFGSFGERARAAAHRFLSDTMADFIASDAHSPYMRTPYVLDAHEMVTELYSPDYADFLFSDNPALLLADKEILPF